MSDAIKALRKEVEQQHAERKTNQAPNLAAHLRRGFANRREYYLAIVRNSSGEGVTLSDPRLQSYANNAGFALPPEFNEDIVQIVQGPGSLAGRCQLLQSKGSSHISVPVDDNPPWNHPLTASWLGDSTQDSETLAPSKPVLKSHQHNLHRVGILLPVSDELLEDAPLLESYLDETAAAKLRWTLDFEILHGHGVARPLGILTSSALIVADSGNPAALDYAALRGMLNRFYGERSRAIWLVHPDTEQTLLDVRDDGGNAVYTFGAGEAVGRMFGVPVWVHEACNPAGTVGDLVLADFGYYRLINKSRRRRLSTHIFFDQHLAAFRYLIAVDGAPMLGAPITSRVGGGTRSPFVALDAR